MKWAGHVAQMGEKSNAFRMMVGKLEVKRPLVRPRCRCLNNIESYRRVVGLGAMNWIDLSQDMDNWTVLVSAMINLRVS
jgi:hypothetical protein